MLQFQFILITSAFVLLQLLAYTLGQIPESLLPALFDDALVDEQARDGPFVPNLGRVVRLDTTMGPTNINKLETKFRIYARGRETCEIEFSPRWIRSINGIVGGHPDTVLQDMLDNPSHYQVKKHGLYQYDIHAMASSGFDPSKKTVIMMAGYLSKEVIPWIREARNRWLRLEDINFIQVTWSDANKYIYSGAVASTPLVGRQVTIFLYYLYALHGLDFREPNVASKVHFVGHSLGAHIGSFLGKDMGGALGRITGLDPAGPSFDRYPPSHRLDPSDAQLVDVIHTNRGTMNYINLMAAAPFHGLDKIVSKLPVLEKFSAALAREYTGEGDTAWFGLDKQVGHIDYYANDGRVQPGCYGLLHTCDHHRATDILLDILGHEINLLELGDPLAQRDRSRLLAFKAESYGDFLSGHGFQSNCAPLIQIGEHLTERAAESISSCSVPIDLLKPVGELRRELVTKHNVNLEPNESITRPQFFFRTLDKRALMGDHFLLKLYVNNIAWNEKVCRLHVEVKLSELNPISIDLSHLMRPTDGEYPVVIAIPFVNPRGVATRALINRQFGYNVPRNVSVQEFIDLRQYLLPDQITITVADAKSKGVVSTLLNKFYNVIKGRRNRGCELGIGMVEVHPVVEWERNYAGLYDLGPPGATERPIEIYRPEDQTSIEWTNDMISMLSTHEYLSTVRTLKAIVIDDRD